MKKKINELEKIICAKDNQITNIGVFDDKIKMYRCYDVRDCYYQKIYNNYKYCSLIKYNIIKND
jgi:hypothetical protein